MTSSSTLTSASAATAAATVASKGASAAATSGKPLRGAARAARDAAGSEALGGSDMGLSLIDRPEALEDAYLQLTHSLGQHNQRAGRVRAAARCWGRRAELLLERGEVGVAQARLSALADLYLVRSTLGPKTQGCLSLCSLFVLGNIPRSQGPFAGKNHSCIQAVSQSPRCFFGLAKAATM